MDLSVSLVFIGCFIGAVMLHEISHGMVALAFGDDTAQKAGRLTLNPLPHIDLLGSIVVPGFLLVVGSPFLVGWAKPVPVNPGNLRNPRFQMLLVSLAGPSSNFVLMGVAAILARTAFQARGIVGVHGDVVLAAQPLLVQALFLFAVVNLLLGVFNLIPIPPLDGSAIIERLLPARALPAWHRFRPYGLPVLFVLLFWTGIFGRIIEPFFERLADFVLE